MGLRGGSLARVVAAVVLVLAASLTTGACSRLRVGSDWDTTADFSGLHSYAWLPAAERDATATPLVDNTLLATRVERAADAELIAKGYSKVEPDVADLLVTYHTVVDRKIDVDTIDTGFGYHVGSWGFLGGTRTYARSYDEGTLILDIMDPQSRQLLWRGWATAEVRPATTPTEREARVAEAVQRMLARFPPETTGDR